MTEVVGFEEVGAMALELVMVVVMEALHGGFFAGAAHLFDLTIGPWMLDLCQPMLDAFFFTAHGEHVRDKGSAWPTGVSRRKSELDAIVSQDGVDFARHRFDMCNQESRGDDPIGVFLQPDKGKFLVRSIATK